MEVDLPQYARDLPPERRSAREHRICERRQGIDVGPRVNGLAPHLLGRAEGDRAERGARRGERRAPAAEELDDAEIEQHDRAVGPPVSQKDIGWLDVPVDDAPVVDRGERAGEGVEDVERLRGGELARPAEPLLQALPGEELHGEIRPAVVEPTALIGLHDARMRERQHDARLPLEPQCGRGVREEVGVEHLHRDRLAGLDVRGAIDDAEPSARDLLLDPIRASPERRGARRPVSRGGWAGHGASSVRPGP